MSKVIDRPEPMSTPLHWQILLHYHAGAEPFGYAGAAFANSLAPMAISDYTTQLHEANLIARRDSGGFKTTDYGAALVGTILAKVVSEQTDGLPPNMMILEREAHAEKHGGKTWRCFYCDEVFHCEHTAADHFGSVDYERPACQIKHHEGHLVHYIRLLEDELDAWKKERHPLQRALNDLQASHADDVRQAERRGKLEGYDRGVADMKAQGYCVEPARHKNV